MPENEQIPDMPELVNGMDAETVKKDEVEAIRAAASAHPEAQESDFAKGMRLRIDVLDKRIEDANAEAQAKLENAQSEYDTTRKMLDAQIETQVQSLKIAQDGRSKLDEDFAVTRGAIIRQSQEKIEACERGKRSTQAYVDAYDEAG